MKLGNTSLAKHNTKGIRQTEKRLAFILIAPAVLYLILVMGLPLLWAVYTSLTDKVIGASEVNFIGLANYIDIIQDPVFQKALLNTFIFAFFAVLGKVVFGVIMSLTMNQPLRGRGGIRVAMILPWTIPTIVSVFAWQWIYSDVGGALNRILMVLHITDHQIGWLSTTNMAMFSVILVNVWRGTPFIAISVLAGLQNISPDLYEAASLDGANVIQRFLYVTLPSVKNVIILAAFVTTIWTLNDFEIVWLMTRGGPSHATELVSTYSYIQGFMNSDIARSIAASLILVPILVILVHYVTKSSLAEEE
ncbi:MAG TPA: sugar ABC transporter permease [Candidatus Blautia intestinavium]|nr:sugar ABC transporter permease [Candidatus Blautia intestinavium]